MTTSQSVRELDAASEVASFERSLDQAPIIGERYRLDQVIDQDDLRTRYLATDLTIGRGVVLEVCQYDPGADPTLEGRLLRRLAHIAQLRHRGVARLLDGGLDERAGPFLVTEPVLAPTLRSVLRTRGRLARARVSAYATDLARTLQSAHNRGLVHGRLCPGNIHLDALSDQIWIQGWLDGAMPRTRARALSAGQGDASAYLAPEMFRDELIGPAADVYGLGVLMMEMLTGEPPSPSARARRRAISGRLQPVIQRALEPDPRHRWQSMEAFAAAIEEATPAASASEAAATTPFAEQASALPAMAGKRSRELGPMLGIVAMLLMFSLIVFGIVRVVGDTPPIIKGAISTVPPMLGKTVAEAGQIARDHDMEVMVVGERESDRYAAGRIMHQSPVPGWRPYDRQPVRVTVSAGVLVPNLAGRTFVEASKHANELGWKIARVETAPGSGQPPTTVLMQFPPPGNLINEPGEIALVIAE